MQWRRNNSLHESHLWYKQLSLTNQHGNLYKESVH